MEEATFSHANLLETVADRNSPRSEVVEVSDHLESAQAELRERDTTRQCYGTRCHALKTIRGVRPEGQIRGVIPEWLQLASTDKHAGGSIADCKCKSLARMPLLLPSGDDMLRMGERRNKSVRTVEPATVFRVMISCVENRGVGRSEERERHDPIGRELRLQRRVHLSPPT